MYRRITFSVRLKIEDMYNNGIKPCRIAKELEYHNSSIYREIKQGLYEHLNFDYTLSKKYSAQKAQSKADINRISQGKQNKLGNDFAFVRFVEHKIKNEHFSPNAVLMYIKQNNLFFKTSVCRVTLYNYIHNGVFLHLSYKDLLRGKPRKRKQQAAVGVPRGRSIEQRPENVNNRSEFGHWEIDSIIGRAETAQTLLVLTERKTRYELIFRSNKTAAETLKIINRLERRFSSAFPHLFKTFTNDNGQEFAYWQRIEKSPYTRKQRCTVYHCHPYCSGERGSNENQNAFIRRFIPKSTPIETVSDEQLFQIQTYINNYPRSIFGGKSASQILESELSKLNLSHFKKFF